MSSRSTSFTSGRTAAPRSVMVPLAHESDSEEQFSDYWDDEPNRDEPIVRRKPLGWGKR